MTRGQPRNAEIPPTEQFVYGNIRPHPEDPITHETFDSLDRTIDAVYASLGIRIEDTRDYAKSSRRGNKPGVTIQRKEAPNNVHILSVSLTDEASVTSIMARNDAGTHIDPNQVAAIASTWDMQGSLIESERPMSNSELTAILAIVEERAEQNGFTKATHRALILGAPS